MQPASVETQIQGSQFTESQNKNTHSALAYNLTAVSAILTASRAGHQRAATRCLLSNKQHVRCHPAAGKPAHTCCTSCVRVMSSSRRTPLDPLPCRCRSYPSHPDRSHQRPLLLTRHTPISSRPTAASPRLLAARVTSLLRSLAPQADCARPDGHWPMHVYVPIQAPSAPRPLDARMPRGARNAPPRWRGLLAGTRG